ncbi:hypothetical protein FHU30_002561 [Actinomadura rupiterrae]|nr:hypothetical protein [Actinomadura rupiterrae]
MTLDEATALLHMSKSSLHRLESAKVTIRPWAVDHMLRVYGVQDDSLRDSLITLAQAGRSKDWIKRHSALLGRPGAGETIRVEQDSRRIRTFQTSVLPGLLQAPEYIRSVVRQPFGEQPEVERAVDLRSARKECLLRDDDPVDFVAVVPEMHIRQPLGGWQVLDQQLRHLLDLVVRENIDIRILALEGTRNPGVDGPFTIFDAEDADFELVVIESLLRTVYIDDEAQVGRYSVVFENLLEASLSKDESRVRIEEALWNLGGPMAHEQPQR